MKKYESIIILNGHIEEENAKRIAGETIEKIKEFTNENRIHKIEFLGLKDLACEIQRNNEGFYFVFTFSTDKINEIENLYHNTSEIIKFIDIAGDDIDDTQTAENIFLNIVEQTETTDETNTETDDEEEGDNIKYCKHCGARIDTDCDGYIVTSDGDYVCEGCRDADYFYCEDCDEYHHASEENEIQDRNGDFHVVCDDCLTNHYFCNHCETYFWDENCGTYDGNCNFICDDCANNYFVRCEYCGELYHESDINYDAELDVYYCDGCEEDNDERRREELDESDDTRILNYHEFRDWKLYFDAVEQLENVPFYIGFELETIQKHYTNDSEDRQAKALGTLSNNLNVVMAHDSSLDEGWGGFEIISHPQSFKYIMNQKETYKKVFDELIQLGYVSHESGCCGLHFHVTRPADDEIVDRIWLIMETYKKQIVELSRRRNCELEHWAKFLSDRTYSDEDKEKLKALYFIKKTDKKSTRYMALNNTNEKTIEFRFFKGTLKYETFFACVEFINNLMTLCSNKKIPVRNITWAKLTEGGFIKPYVYEKNILTAIKPKDNSLELIRKENKQKAIMQKINKILFNYAKRKLAGIDTNRGELSNLNNFFEKTATMRNKFFELYDTAEYLNALHSRQQNGETRQFLARLNDLMNYNSENIWRNLTEEEKTEISTLKLQLESI